MALEFRVSHGKLLPWFYGRYWEKGRSKVVNTGIRWKGIPPISLRFAGDNVFEASRNEAVLAFARIRAGARVKLQGALESKCDRPGEKQADTTRSALRQSPISSIPHQSFRPTLVHYLPKRHAAPSANAEKNRDWYDWRRSVVEHFSTWLETVCGKRDAASVTRAVAEAYMAVLQTPDTRGRRCTTGTIRTKRDVLAMVFDRALPPDFPNPFRNIPIDAPPGDRVINRLPLDRAEVAALLRAGATTDPEARDWILAALSTGLRRGDICRLRWDSVDFDSNVLRVTTSKTGAALELPILPAFREMLKKRRAAFSGSVPDSAASIFVFPEAETLINSNPDAVTRRVKRIFAVAFATPSGNDPSALVGRQRAAIEQVTLEERDCGLYRASVRDFHSLRTTFVTLAINGGIPIDKLRVLTGHRTVDMVLRHYYKPRGSDLAADLAKALPSVIVGS